MTMLNGALVQLVRMPACHAGGRWFESCTHRNKISLTSLTLMRDVFFKELCWLLFAANGALKVLKGHGAINNDDRGFLVLREEEEDVLVAASLGVD